MAGHKFIHRDITLMNILMDDNYKFRYIDFGLSMTHDELLRKLKTVNKVYFSQAPEMYLLWLYNQGGSIDKLATLDSFVEKLFSDKDFITYMWGISEIVQTENINEAFNILHNIPLSYILTGKVLDKSDVYSLGMSLAMFFQQIHTAGLIDEKLHEVFKNLCSKMADFNYVTRLSPLKALKEYIDIIRTLFSDKIYQYDIVDRALNLLYKKSVDSCVRNVSDEECDLEWKIYKSEYKFDGKTQPGSESERRQVCEKYVEKGLNRSLKSVELIEHEMRNKTYGEIMRSPSEGGISYCQLKLLAKELRYQGPWNKAKILHFLINERGVVVRA